MTQHEQKPESAEFRTREAQIDGQIGYIFEAHEVEDTERTITKGSLRLMLEAAHRQAEARGAAEQRRKDAEGAEPAGYRHRAYVEFDDYERIVFSGSSEHKWHEDGKGVIYTTTPLYFHPANVAALEARVKELEGAINAACERLSAPAWTICSSTHCERARECRSPGECGGTGKPSALRILRAAAIREGGEHG